MRSAPSTNVVSVIDRVVSVLASFRVDDERLGVSELARRANLPKSTVSRLVSELVEHRYLERDAAGVRLGLRLFELGQLATRPNALRAIAVEAMADLRDETGNTVELAVLDGDDVIRLGVVHARGRSRQRMRVGVRSPAHLTAAGRVLLAFSTPDAAARVAGRVRLEPRDADALADDLAAIRQRGVAFEIDPSSGRVVGVAAAISAGGGAVAAIAASGDTGAFDAWRVTPALQAAALGIQRRAA